MTLGRRIAAAVAVGVALLVCALGVVGYVTIRSDLRGSIDAYLARQGRPYTDEQIGPPRPAKVTEPAPEPFGGASGYYQFVRAHGRAFSGDGPPLLPHGSRELAIARTGKGRFYVDETVRGVHLRVLTVADPDASIAVQIARPLTEIDDVLNKVLITYAIVIGVGVALAALFGGLIGRAALLPVVRFTRRSVGIGAPDPSARLDPTGPRELADLAASFNRMLDALERSVRAQKNLVADASHELRTPVAALRSNIQIFLDADRLPPGERASLQLAILAELDQLTQLVTDVVELAHENEPNEELDRVSLDVVVADVIDRARRRASDLSFDVSLEATQIENVPERVERAVANLIDNACAWSPPGGTVVVRLTNGTLTVRDHGSGFQEKDLPFVFDRFYRAEPARRRPGSGLGLAIVRQAAEARGGLAEAENAEGGGALLRVRFGPPSVSPELSRRKNRLDVTP